MEQYKPWGMEEKSFLGMMHLSQLAGYIVPGAGFVLPIVMWATNRNESVKVDRHGKIILNWLISAFIYSIIGAILVFVVVGIFALIALAIVSLIFAVLGAVKAFEDKEWHYPLAFRFFSVE